MKKPIQLLILLAITGLEAIALTAAGFFYAIEAITGHARHLPTLIALTVLIFAFAAWASAAVKGLAALKSWARSSAVFIQTAMLAIGYYSFQGESARPDIAWALIIPALVVLVLLFTKPLSSEFKREF